MGISTRGTESNMVDGGILCASGDCDKNWIEVRDGERSKGTR